MKKRMKKDAAGKKGLNLETAKQEIASRQKKGNKDFKKFNEEPVWSYWLVNILLFMIKTQFTIFFTSDGITIPNLTNE